MEPSRSEQLDEVGPAAPAIDSRDAAFGYVCRQCSRCCHHKDIHVNPYEVARLARRSGQTTAQFSAASTQEGAGAVLERTAKGACVFLGPAGCTVHADRPLVCRLYPLGRHLLPDGTEWFSHLEPHPQSAGELTGRGTVADYLAAQGAAPFLAAAQEYFQWLCAARAFLGAAAGPLRSDDQSADARIAADLVDMDAAIARHCGAQGISEPADIEARRALHLEILYEQIGSEQRRTP
jgi:Fe-S-cluster containining protein